MLARRALLAHSGPPSIGSLSLSPLLPALPQTLTRKPFKIRTSVARPDLRIPKDLSHLATPLFPALPQILTRKLFKIRTSVAHPDLRIPKDLPHLATPLFPALTGPHPNCGKQRTYNPFRICTYVKLARNSFRIRTYKNQGGGGATLPSLLLPSSFFQNFLPPRGIYPPGVCQFILYMCNFRGRRVQYPLPRPNKGVSMRVPALVAFLFVVSSAPALRAQSTNASLSGRVTDPSHAAIAQAQVDAVSLSTDVRYVTTTNASGEYALANLPPGPYRLEIAKPGFKKLVKPDVILHVQDALEINLELSVGSASEIVTVEGGAPLVNTESATVSTLVDRTFVADMPLNGRSFQTLILLSPGVVPTVTVFNDQGQFSVNGQRADANYFTVDGVSANFGVNGYFPLLQSASGSLPALTASGGTNSLVSIDAMQEFRIQTSSFAPEFGRTPGGQISVVTRSGTNSFHGTAFDYFRNAVLDANDWFANFNRLPKPAERQNDFGGVFGGPILKDKTFFFFSYEGLRLGLPSTQETAVPCDATCTVFGNARAMAPSGTQPFLNAYPLPDGPELFNPCTPNVNGCPASGQRPTGLAQFNATFSNPSSLDAYSIRLDHVINSKFTLFGRYNYSPSNVDSRGAFAPPQATLSAVEPLSSSVQTVTLGLAETITPGISNELRANYSNDRVATRFFLDNFGGAVPLPDSALFPSGFSSANSAFEFYIVGSGIYEQGKQAADEQRQVNLIDNLSWSKGSHQMKFGVDYRWLSPFSSPEAYAQVLEFTGMSANPGQALSGSAAFAFVHNLQTDTLLGQDFSLYGQDTWKLTRRLTLTYGLRWDINPSIKGKNLANDPFTLTEVDNPATIALAPRGTRFYDTTYGNVAPRVGAAYQLREGSNWGSVLRAGFGTFYDLGTGEVGGAGSYFPFHTDTILVNVPVPLSPQNAAQPPLTTNPPVNTMFATDPHLKLPRTYEWNVALEQSIGDSQSLSVTYVGALGRDLLRVTNLFNQNPNFLFISVTDNSARSYYNALQLKFQRRLSHGLQALASYTFSHSIDNVSTDSSNANSNTPGGGSYQSADRGDSDFDIRHSFTAGVTYDLPSPGSQKLVRAMFGGWSLDSFILARSAPPVDVVGALNLAYGSELESRPNLVPGVPLVLYGSQYPGGRAFNNTLLPGACPGGKNQVGAWCPAPAGTQGNFGRNVLRGFGATQADLAVQRQFHLTEQMSLRFRSEFFNIFNHPNFGNPINSLTSPLFGRSTETLASSLGSGGANGGFSPLYQIGGPRSIQFALKLQF